MVFSRKSKSLALLVSALGLLAFSNAAFAQDDPETGDVGDEEGTASVGGEWGGSLQGQTSTSTSTDSASQWQADSTANTSSSDSGTSLSGSDHDSVVGSVGIGFFGISGIPVGYYPTDPADLTETSDEISAPTIGIRYWLSSLLGVEVAVGIGISSNSLDVGAGGSVDEPSFFGFALHGGVPLALAHVGHFAFEIIPDLNFGVSSGSQEDNDYSGILFQIGGRLGAELQFGFIGVPQLSLLTSFGVHFSYESRDYPVDANESRIYFGTTIGSEPWRSFMGSINLLYYL